MPDAGAELAAQRAQMQPAFVRRNLRYQIGQHGFEVTLARHECRCCGARRKWRRTQPHAAGSARGKRAGLAPDQQIDPRLAVPATVQQQGPMRQTNDERCQAPTPPEIRCAVACQTAWAIGENGIVAPDAALGPPRQKQPVIGHQPIFDHAADRVLRRHGHDRQRAGGKRREGLSAEARQPVHRLRRDLAVGIPMQPPEHVRRTRQGRRAKPSRNAITNC